MMNDLQKIQIKKDILRVLAPIFGVRVEKMVQSFYDTKNDVEVKEFVFLASEMLEGYTGKANKDRIMAEIMRKYPDIAKKMAEANA